MEAAQIDGRLARRPLKDSQREFKAHEMLSSHITQLMQKYDTAIKVIYLHFSCLKYMRGGGNLEKIETVLDTVFDTQLESK